jgi:hypothetical protein
MLILFDQGTPIGIRPDLTNPAVKTAYEQGWSRPLNGELVRAAGGTGFEVLNTRNANLPYQQDLRSRKLAVVALSQNRWKLVETALPEIVAAIEKRGVGNVHDCGNSPCVKCYWTLNPLGIRIWAQEEPWIRGRLLSFSQDFVPSHLYQSRP